MFHQITIIGFGLIGSSLARAIIEHNLTDRLVCVDNNPDYCQQVLAMGLADEATSDPVLGVEGSDFVIFCTPVGIMGNIAAQIGDNFAPNAIITDVGSVKNAVIEAVAPHIPDHAHFVPSHPIAGAEKSGPTAGIAELFMNRWSIITPLPETDLRAMEKITAFWEACGSNVDIMTPDHHDLVLGITSHLPHLIAYTIVGTATELEDDLKSEVIQYSAGGFRDFTRIAASDPAMWRDVFLNNKDAVLEILQRFTEDLTALQRAIRKQDGEYLYQSFTKTRDIRRAIIDAGQADYPTIEE